MRYSSLISGLAGSLALTLFHQLLKKTVTSAPRMDKLGEEGLTKILHATGSSVPSEDDLYKITLGGDIIGNAGYYALVGTMPGHPVVAGTVLGLTAGIGAVVLPEKIGLNEEHSNATTKTKMLTVLIYLTGGLVAGGLHSFLDGKASGGKRLSRS